MPPRNWRKVVDDFTRVQQLVHLANRLQPESAIDIQGKLYQQKRVAYEDTLTAQAAAVGCAGKKGVTDMATLANMMGEAGDEAEGIINTYNYDMALAIRNIAATTPTANRHVYAKRLAEWEAIRNEWKSKQIMLWNTMKWQDKAIADFLEHNPQLRQGTAEVQPQETAVCDICRTWVERGKVPIARTKEVDWPAHLNCPHHWVIKYGVESVDCSKLWVGTDFEAWLAQVGQKGGAGSGNWGHAGRPGIVGGSGGSRGAISESGAVLGHGVPASERMPKGIPAKHTAGLMVVVDDSPTVREGDFRGKYSEGSPPDTPHRILVRPDVDDNTLLHELGHHVTNGNAGIKGVRLSSEFARDGLIQEVLQTGKTVRQTWWKYGLTEYESEGTGETWAGLYRVRALANTGDVIASRQFNALRVDAPLFASEIDRLFE